MDQATLKFSIIRLARRLISRLEIQTPKSLASIQKRRIKTIFKRRRRRSKRKL